MAPMGARAEPSLASGARANHITTRLHDAPGHQSAALLTWACAAPVPDPLVVLFFAAGMQAQSPLPEVFGPAEIVGDVLVVTDSPADPPVAVRKLRGSLVGRSCHRVHSSPWPAFPAAWSHGHGHHSSRFAMLKLELDVVVPHHYRGQVRPAPVFAKT